MFATDTTPAPPTTMAEIRTSVGAYVARFDPDVMSAVDAQRVVDDAIACEHMLATVKALAARRVAGTELWRTEGDRSPAHHLARKSGTSVTKGPRGPRHRRPSQQAPHPRGGGAGRGVVAGPGRPRRRGGHRQPQRRGAPRRVRQALLAR